MERRDKFNLDALKIRIPNRDSDASSSDSDTDTDCSYDNSKLTADKGPSKIITSPRLSLSWDHSYDIVNKADSINGDAESDKEWLRHNKTDDDKLSDDCADKEHESFTVKRSKIKTIANMTRYEHDDRHYISAVMDTTSPRGLPDVVPDSPVDCKSESSTENGDVFDESVDRELPHTLPETALPLRVVNDLPPPLPCTSPPNARFLVSSPACLPPSSEIYENYNTNLPLLAPPLTAPIETNLFNLQNQADKSNMDAAEQPVILNIDSDGNSDSDEELIANLENELSEIRSHCIPDNEESDVQSEEELYDPEVDEGQSNEYSDSNTSDPEEEIESPRERSYSASEEEEFEAILQALDINNAPVDTWEDRFADRRDRFGFILSPVIEGPSPTPSSLSGYSGMSAASPDPFSMFRVSPGPNRTGIKEMDLTSLSIRSNDFSDIEYQTVPIYEAKRVMAIPESSGWESGSEILSPTGSVEWDKSENGLSSPTVTNTWNNMGTHLLGWKTPEEVIYEVAESSSAEDCGDSDDTIQEENPDYMLEKNEYRHMTDENTATVVVHQTRETFGESTETDENIPGNEIVPTCERLSNINDMKFSALNMQNIELTSTNFNENINCAQTVQDNDIKDSCQKTADEFLSSKQRFEVEAESAPLYSGSELTWVVGLNDSTDDILNISGEFVGSTHDIDTEIITAMQSERTSCHFEDMEPEIGISNNNSSILRDINLNENCVQTESNTNSESPDVVSEPSSEDNEDAEDEFSDGDDVTHDEYPTDPDNTNTVLSKSPNKDILSPHDTIKANQNNDVSVSETISPENSSCSEYISEDNIEASYQSSFGSGVRVFQYTSGDSDENTTKAISEINSVVNNVDTDVNKKYNPLNNYEPEISPPTVSVSPLDSVTSNVDASSLKGVGTDTIQCQCLSKVERKKSYMEDVDTTVKLPALDNETINACIDNGTESTNIEIGNKLMETHAKSFTNNTINNNRRVPNGTSCDALSSDDDEEIERSISNFIGIMRGKFRPACEDEDKGGQDSQAKLISSHPFAGIYDNSVSDDENFTNTRAEKETTERTKKKRIIRRVMSTPDSTSGHLLRQSINRSNTQSPVKIAISHLRRKNSIRRLMKRGYVKTISKIFSGTNITDDQLFVRKRVIAKSDIRPFEAPQMLTANENLIITDSSYSDDTSRVSSSTKYSGEDNNNLVKTDYSIEDGCILNIDENNPVIDSVESISIMNSETMAKENYKQRSNISSVTRGRLQRNNAYDCEDSPLFTSEQNSIVQTAGEIFGNSGNSETKTAIFSNKCHDSMIKTDSDEHNGRSPGSSMPDQVQMTNYNQHIAEKRDKSGVVSIHDDQVIYTDTIAVNGIKNNGSVKKNSYKSDKDAVNLSEILFRAKLTPENRQQPNQDSIVPDSPDKKRRVSLSDIFSHIKIQPTHLYNEDFEDQKIITVSPETHEPEVYEMVNDFNLETTSSIYTEDLYTYYSPVDFAHCPHGRARSVETNCDTDAGVEVCENTQTTINSKQLTGKVEKYKHEHDTLCDTDNVPDTSLTYNNGTNSVESNSSNTSYSNSNNNSASDSSNIDTQPSSSYDSTASNEHFSADTYNNTLQCASNSVTDNNSNTSSQSYVSATDGNELTESYPEITNLDDDLDVTDGQNGVGVPENNPNGTEYYNSYYRHGVYDDSSLCDTKVGANTACEKSPVRCYTTEYANSDTDNSEVQYDADSCNSDIDDNVLYECAQAVHNLSFSKTLNKQVDNLLSADADANRHFRSPGHDDLPQNMPEQWEKPRNTDYYKGCEFNGNYRRFTDFSSDSDSGEFIADPEINPEIFEHTCYHIQIPFNLTNQRGSEPLNTQSVTQGGDAYRMRDTCDRNLIAYANRSDAALPRAIHSEAQSSKHTFTLPMVACQNKGLQVNVNNSSVSSSHHQSGRVNTSDIQARDSLHLPVKNDRNYHQVGVHVSRRINGNVATHQIAEMQNDVPLSENKLHDTFLTSSRINDTRATQHISQSRMSTGRANDSQTKCLAERGQETASHRLVDSQNLPKEHVFEYGGGNLRILPYSTFENTDRLPVRVVRSVQHQSEPVRSSMKLIQDTQRTSEMPENKMVQRYHSSSTMPANTTGMQLMKTHGESVHEALSDANGNTINEEDLAAVLPQIAESVAKMKNVNAEEILPGITQSVSKLQNGGNLVITTMTRKVEGDDTPVTPEPHPVIEVDDIDNSKIYLVQDSQGDMFYVEDITNESQESAYYSSSRNTSGSVSDSGVSPSYDSISKIQQHGGSNIKNATAEELIGMMYNQPQITELNENEEEFSERTYEYDIPRQRSYTVEEPESMPHKVRTKDNYQSSYEMSSSAPWVYDGAQGQRNYSQNMTGEELESVSNVSDNYNTSLRKSMKTSESTGTGYMASAETYTMDAEASMLPLVPANTTTVYATPPAPIVMPQLCAQVDEPSYQMVTVDVTPKQTEVKPSPPEPEEHRPIYKTVAHIQTKEKPPPLPPMPVDMTDSKKYKIIETKATETEEVQEAKLSMDEVDYRFTAENVEYRMSPTFQRKHTFVHNTAIAEPPPQFKTEKRLEINRNSDQKYKTEIQVQDNRDYDENRMEESSYFYNEQRSAQNMAQNNTDMKIVRGTYLIKNTLDEPDNSLDDNLNLFDGQYTLCKDNPLYQSDEDIYKRHEREKAQMARKQDRFNRDLNQDITFETVDRFSKSKEVKRDERPKQSLSELLLSRLSTIDSKDIRQHIDVKHHSEDIYGDPRFLHADGTSAEHGSSGTNNFDSVGEKVDLLLKEGKAFITVKVTAERITPVDFEFNVWRKNQAIVTRTIEVDLLATEQRRRLYYRVMAEEPTSGSRAYRVGPNETVLDSEQTLDLFTRILGASDGGDREDIEIKTRQGKTTRPFSSGMDLMY